MTTRRVLAASVLVSLAVWAGSARAQTDQALEGDPFKGRGLFVDKLCVECHSLWGHGGTLGPNIVRVVAGKPLPQLSGEFWNHTPRMIEEIAGKGRAWPSIDRNEMADILSYLYYLRLFDDPGDPVRGATVFERHRCGSCHSVGGEGGSVGQTLDKFSVYVSPVPLARAMWNEGPAMRESQLATGTPIPEFSSDEMAQIQAYIRARGVWPDTGGVELLALPDPARGERVFRAKRCSACHGTGERGAPDLQAAALRLTVAEIGGILWNHSYAMQNQMRAVGIPFPRFEEGELADLISYLHLIGYRGRPGNPTRGADVFARGCAACHGDEGSGAPDLVSSRSVDDTIALSASMWNHAPQMHELMAERAVPWPKFEASDMEDLIAFLQRLASED